MSPIPIIGALISLVELYIHTPWLHYLNAAWQTFCWALLFLGWWRLKRSKPPVAVLYGCPNHCGFLGDMTAVEAHIDRCRVAARR